MLKPDQVVQARAIAEEYKWRVSGGATSSMLIAMENMAIKEGKGDWDAVRKMHNQAINSQSVISEFDTRKRK